MKLKRSSVRLAMLLLVGAGAYFLASDYIDNSIETDLQSEDLEVLAHLPPLSDEAFSAVTTRTSKDLEKRSYKQAVSAVVLAANWRGKTPEQSVTLRNSILNLKVTLASAALEGDTNAAEAIEILKSKAVAAR